MRMCVAAAAGVALSTMGVAGASASGAASTARQAVRVNRAGTSLAAASPGAQLWAKRYNGTGNNADVAAAVAASPTGGTVYVTGQSYGAYGTALVVDYATVAYNAATGTQQWVARYHGPTGADVPSAVAVSPDGKTVFVTGKSMMANGQNDYATVAYNAATGHQLWAKGYNGPLNNDDAATAVAVSPDSKTVYVTGSSWGKVSGLDYATIAYTVATGAQQWVKRYTGPGGNYDNANSMAVSPTGTVYVTGQSVGATSGYDYATVAYDPTGRQLWVKRYTFPGGNTDDAHSVAVSPDGKTVYVTGQSWGGASAWDYATVAYNAGTGAQQWVKRYNGPGNAYDLASSVAVSPDSGTVYVTGQSAGTSSGADYATIAYTAATGTRQWIARYNDTGNGTDIATSLAVNPASGTVYVTGQSFAPSGLYDYATIAYSSSGAQQWARRPVGSVQYPSSVAVSPATGAVVITGANTGDYTTTAYQG